MSHCSLIVVYKKKKNKIRKIFFALSNDHSEEMYREDRLSRIWSRKFDF